ncbi:MAG: glycerophosphodiester phosphodiesterase [Opitutales bacterium]
MATFGNAYGLDCIAHRGYSANATENTLDSLHASWAAGADLVEADVWLLADGELALFHDREVRGAVVSELTYPKLQSLLDFHLPKLEEALDVIPKDKGIVVDLKTSCHKTRDRLLALFDRLKPEYRVIIQSSDLSALQYMDEKTEYDFDLHYLSHLKRSGLTRQPPSAGDLAKRLVEAGIDGISFKGRQFIDQDFVDLLKSAGLRCFVWTINDPERMLYYSNLKVDGVITKDPPAFRRTITEKD